MGMTMIVMLEPQLAYYVSGQHVSGQVKVVVDSLTSCRAILVKAKGYCQVEWYDADASEEEHRHNFQEEVYFENVITAWTGTNYGDNLIPGEFTFPFQFILPPDIPSTYESLHGHIRYEVEAKADNPWGNGPKALARFPVKCNSSPSSGIDEALSFHIEDTICCCCCEEGPLLVHLVANKRGFIAGENIEFSGEVTNKTETAISDGIITLKEKITFNAKGRTKKVNTELQERTQPGFPAGGMDVWRSVPLTIPDHAVCLRFCTLITSQHKVKIQFNMGWMSDVHVEKYISLEYPPVRPLGQPTEAEQASVPPPFVPVEGAPGPSAPMAGGIPQYLSSFAPGASSSADLDLPPSYDSVVPSCPPYSKAAEAAIQDQPKSVMAGYDWKDPAKGSE